MEGDGGKGGENGEGEAGREKREKSERERGGEGRGGASIRVSLTHPSPPPVSSRCAPVIRGKMYREREWDA